MSKSAMPCSCVRLRRRDVSHIDPVAVPVSMCSSRALLKRARNDQVLAMYQTWHTALALLLVSRAADVQVLTAAPEVANLADPVFVTLATDAGLEQLVPYIVAHVATAVRTSAQSITHLLRLLQTAAALTANRRNNLGAYLAQLLPAVMTCLLTARLGPPRAPPLPAHLLSRWFVSPRRRLTERNT